MKNEHLVVLSFGSNKGDYKAIFNAALNELNQIGTVDRTSSVYETEPWGLKDQPWFKNMIVGILSNHDPEEILNFLLNLEREHGRDRKKEQRWGQRTLDLDILVYGNRTISTEELDVPHPRMVERMFILTPLSEIYPDLIIPVFEKSARSLLFECKDSTELKRLSNAL